jgi:beta-carotene 3-hydroxylase
MSWIANLAIVLATIVAMEVMTRYSHEYIMHGVGWRWHKSHHAARHGVFEQNDLYAVFFAALAIGLIYHGYDDGRFTLWLGVGATVYGVLYFLLHDALVHKRWPFKITPKGRYLKRLVQAHHLHHAVHGKDKCVSFGFIYAKPVDELRKELHRLHGDNGREVVCAAGKDDAAPLHDPR